MAIAFGAVGTRLNQTTAATTWNVAYPAGITAGDLLVLFISSNGGAASATPPSGFTEVHRETTVTNPRGGLWIKVATGSESGPLAVTMTSTTGHAQIARYSGVDTTTPQDATRTIVQNTGTTVAHVILPSITTATNGAMLVFVGAWNSSSRTASPPAGATERIDFISNGGATKSGALDDEIDATAGASGTRQITSSSGTGIANWGAMMALRPGGSTGDVAAVTATATADAPAPTVSNGAAAPASYRANSVGNTQDTAVGTNLTMARPTGTVDGDLLVAMIIQDQDASVKTGMPAPTGWTKIANSSSGVTANGQVAIYTHTAASGDPGTWSWTNDSTGQPDTHGTIIAVANTNGTVSAGPTFQYSTATGTAYTAPSVTGTDRGLLICGFFRSDSAAATASFTMSAPLTERVDNNAASSWTGLGVGTEELTAAGATGTRSATNTDTARWTAVSMVVDPVPGDTPGDVAAVAATGTAAAPAPGVSVGVPVAGIKATATATALAPTLQAGATVTAVAATATAAGQAPSLTYGYTVQAIKATATSAGQAPTVGAGGTVAGQAATVTAAAIAPTVTAAAGSTVQAVPATASVLAPAPAVGAGTTQAAVKATATAAAAAPSVAYGATVVAIAATSTAAALAPAVSAGQVTTVQAVAATATAAAVVPVLHAFGQINAPAVPVTVQAPAPAWSGGATVTAPAATGSAAAIPPTVTSTPVVTAPQAAVAASAPAPVVAYGATVVVLRATATAASLVPQYVQGDGAVSLTAVRAVVTGSAPAPGVQAFKAVFANPPAATAAVATYAPSVGGQAAVTGVRATITVQAKPVVLMGTLRDLALSGSPLASTATVASLGTRIDAVPISYTIRSGVPLYGPMTTEPLYGRFRIEE